ncbi:glyoxalase superfamily protein [Streptomyces sp. NPDC002574]|uniref:glyoxalase superfamily protein n=1 Tax=Streptomyces sp. NPDC002574 TaxID=3364652 RepID=UPI003696FC3F
MDLKLELVLLPVADFDRAKAFYSEKLGFSVHVDHRAGDDFRVVQLDPPGSACSIAVGKGITDAAPGSVRGLHLVVGDIEAVHKELTARGVPLGGVRHMTAGGWVDGADPGRTPYNSFADFADPDGNTWVLQEVRRGHGEQGEKDGAAG